MSKWSENGGIYVNQHPQKPGRKVKLDKWLANGYTHFAGVNYEKLSIVTGTQPLYDFLDTVDGISTFKASEMKWDIMEGKKVYTFRELIKVYRHRSYFLEISSSKAENLAQSARHASNTCK